MVDKTERTGPGWARRWATVFGIDPRSLAVFRIAVGLVLLINLGIWSVDLPEFFSEQGMFPQSLVHQFHGPEHWRWSLYFLHPSWAWQVSLMALSAPLAVLLMAGWRTRWVTAANWILLVSLHTRVPALVTGGDVLLSMMLLWGVFLPLGRRWSWDAWRAGRPADNTPVVSVASAVIQLQVAVMYFYTGISKSNELWFGGQALENVLQYDLLARPFGHWLLAFPWLLNVLTRVTVVWELIGPWLLFSPWATRWIRGLAVAAFAILHLGIELCMNVVIFSYASWAALTLFLPDWVWQRDLAGQATSPESSLSSMQPKRPAGVDWRTRIAQGVCGGLAVIVFLDSALMMFKPQSYGNAPRALHRVSELLVIGQRWDMFAYPAHGDFRFVALAQLQDGTHVDLLRNGEPVELKAAPHLPTDSITPRWMELYIELQRDTNHLFRQYLIQWLEQRWNAEQGPSRQVQVVTLLSVEAVPGSDDIKTVLYAQRDPLAEGPYVDGRRHGRWLLRHPNGQKSAQGAYRHGREHGVWRYWDEQGRLEGQGAFVDGQMHGHWTFWYADGQRRDATYEHDRLVR